MSKARELAELSRTVADSADAVAITINSDEEVTFASDIDVTGSVTATGTSVFASLDISGDIDVDGTANLDVVDIDGAVNMASTLAVGGPITLTAGALAAAGNAGLSHRSTDNKVYLQAGTGGFNILDDQQNTHFFIDSAGAATFSSTIAATGATLSGVLELDASGNIPTNGIGLHTNNFVYLKGGSSGLIASSQSGGENFRLNANGIVFNEDSGDLDFRVESNGNANMLFVDGGTDSVGIGTGAPSSTYKLDVAGAVRSTANAPSFNLQESDASNQHWVFGSYAGTLALRDVTGGTYPLQIANSGVTTNSLNLTGTETVVNDSGADRNFRVESDTDEYALFVDGATGGVQMGGGEDQFTGMGGAADGRLSLVNTGNGHAQLGLFRQDTSISAGNELGSIIAFSNHTADNDIMPVVKIVMASDGAFGPDDNPTKLQFYTTPDASETIREVGKFDNTGMFTANYGMVVNETGNNPTGDFRVESDSNANMLFVDAGNNRVGVGVGTPFTTLQVGARTGAGTTNPNTGSVLSVSKDGATGIDLGGNVNAGAVVGAINWVNYYGVGNYNTARIDTYAQGNSNSGELRFWTASIASSPTERMRIKSTGGLITTPAAGGGAVFNEDGVDADFRVESNSNANMLFVDAGNDQVIIGASSGLNPSDAGLYARDGLIVGNFSGSGNGFTVYRGSGLNTNINHDSTKAFLTTSGIPLHFRTTLDTNYKISMETDGVVINEGGADYDFRVESDGNANMLFVDGGANTVGIGTNVPTHKLEIRNDVSASTDLDPTSIKLYNNSDGGSAIEFSNGVAGKSKISFGVESTGAGTDETYLGFSTAANAGSLTERMRIGSGGVIATYPAAGGTFVINENGVDTDFRVESDNSTHALFVDGSNDRVSIRNSSEINSGALSVNGSITFNNQTAGTYNHASGFIDFTDGGDANLLRLHAGADAGEYSKIEISTNIAGSQSDAISVENTGPIVINQDSVAARDFRVESDNMTHALFVEGSDGKVGVFNAAPTSTLVVGSPNGRYGLQLNGGPNGVASQIHMVDGKSGTFTTLTIDIQLGGAGGYMYQVQVAGTAGCNFQTGGGYTNGTVNFGHTVATGSGFTVTSPSNNLIRLVAQSGVGTHPVCEIKITQALSSNHDQDDVTITWS